MINVVFNLKDFSRLEDIELGNPEEIKKQFGDVSVDAQTILQKVFAPNDSSYYIPYSAFVEATQAAVNCSKNVLCLNTDDTTDDETADNSPCLFSEFGGDYWTQGYVGSINYTKKTKSEEHPDDDSKANAVEYNVTVNFRSRFDDEKSLFLMYVFEKAFDVKGKIYEDMKVKVSNESSFDLLLILRWFKTMSNALKKGIYRCYREFEHNDSTIKGRLDIPRHIKENMMLDNGKICYTTREFTADNSMNHLILRAFEHLQKRHGAIVRQLLKSSSFPECEKGLRLLQNELFDAQTFSDASLIKQNKKKIVHSVYRAYEPLRETCIMILRRYGMNNTRNRQAEASGLLISMPGLWERFLYNDILRKVTGSAQPYRQEVFSIIEGRRDIKPDFLLPDQEPRIVLDAKYKASWGEAYKSNIPFQREDTYQVLSYMFVLNVKKGGVIFPLPPRAEAEIKTEAEIKSFKIFNDKCGDFLLIPYHVSGEKDPREFRSDMQRTSQTLVDEIKKLLSGDKQHSAS